jgi:hypothetical protein
MSARPVALAAFCTAIAVSSQACYVPIPDVWYSDAAEPECEQHADCYLGEGYQCATCSGPGVCLYNGETGETCGEHGICIDWRCIEVR